MTESQDRAPQHAIQYHEAKRALIGSVHVVLVGARGHRVEIDDPEVASWILGHDVRGLEILTWENTKPVLLHPSHMNAIKTKMSSYKSATATEMKRQKSAFETYRDEI